MTHAREVSMTGGCQCGAVRYQLHEMPRVSVCFCRMCQKAVGGYFGAFAGLEQDKLTWTKGEPSLFSSSQVAERGFCKSCGTPLTFRYKDTKRISVTAGSLDEPARIVPDKAFGMEGRMPFFDLLCRLSGTQPRMTFRRTKCRATPRCNIPTARFEPSKRLILLRCLPQLQQAMHRPCRSARRRRGFHG